MWKLHLNVRNKFPKAITSNVLTVKIPGDQNNPLNLTQSLDFSPDRRQKHRLRITLNIDIRIFFFILIMKTQDTAIKFKKMQQEV